MAKQKREYEDLIDEVYRDADISRITTYVESLKKRLDAVEEHRLHKDGTPRLWPSLHCDLDEEERKNL